MNELALFWQRAFFVVLVTLIHLSTSGEISILTDCAHTQQTKVKKVKSRNLTKCGLFVQVLSSKSVILPFSLLFVGCEYSLLIFISDFKFDVYK